MLFCIAIISFSGFLLKEVCRRGQTFMGLSRRAWSDIHLWASIVILVLLIVHIVLHWSAIDSFFKKHIPHNAARYALYALFLALALISTIPWLFIF